MGFADFYFQRFKIYNSYFPNIDVDTDLKLIVVIPSYREFKLFYTLECLSKNEFDFKTEVIIVFNAKTGEDEQLLQMHLAQAKNSQQFSKPNLRFIPIIEHDIPPKISGAGLARKLGMDLALHRFNTINNRDGIIVSLDADTICEKNYLQAIKDNFEQHPKAPGATIAFEHPISGTEFPQEIYSAIVLYELYMRYYIQALRYAKFPYAYHTVGSAFAVRAWAYAQQGGMGLHSAGEDFYFLHKIIPLGNFFEIKNTRVYPSPRLSNRVVFGTGPAIRKIITEKMSDFDTYPLEAFEILKPLFEKHTLLFTKNYKELEIHPLLEIFLAENEFDIALQKMRENSSSTETFSKRFYGWFDAFRVLKFLNFISDEQRIGQKPVTQEARQLLKKVGRTPGFSARDLLLEYRQIQNN